MPTNILSNLRRFAIYSVWFAEKIVPVIAFVFFVHYEQAVLYILNIGIEKAQSSYVTMLFRFMNNFGFHVLAMPAYKYIN